jgi:hypothetical protein
VAWVPTDWNSAAWSYMRLSTGLTRDAALNDFDGFLAGLAAATGLGALVLDGAPPWATEYVDKLPAEIHPTLGALLTHTTAALGASVLTYRT